MPYQVDDALPHAMSGTELSRVRTELRLLPPEPNNQRLLASRGADVVMQSSGQGPQWRCLREVPTCEVARKSSSRETDKGEGLHYFPDTKPAHEPR
jgi:hypothetical protein